MRRLGVVIPAGPGDNLEDTIASVVRFEGTEVAIVVVDDTRGPEQNWAIWRAMGRNISVAAAPPGAPGTQGGLWVKIMAGLDILMKEYSIDVALKMDTDALMIAPGFSQAALQALAEDPSTGILGAVAVGTDGGHRDWSPPARELASECGLRGFRNPALRRELRSRVRTAYSYGYRDGEHAQGGAYVLSVPFCRWLCGAPHYVDHRVFTRSKLGEDQIAGLLCRAAGFSLREFSRPGDPMAIKWRGLSASPETLLGSNARVVHSVRSFEDRSEEDIRAVFRRARDQCGEP